MLFCKQKERLTQYIYLLSSMHFSRFPISQMEIIASLIFPRAWFIHFLRLICCLVCGSRFSSGQVCDDPFTFKETSATGHQVIVQSLLPFGVHDILCSCLCGRG